MQQFLKSDSRVPTDVALPRQIDRQLARLLDERREYNVVDIVEALQALSQPELLVTDTRPAELISRREAASTVETAAVVAPVALPVS